ncbi:hypothetical protein FA10DRAFT_264349 [Acaromyces ingoldii]|uniref:Saccharopine dehydrogenase NADP binding domain-containing protein n=1 Tax=Acaromyces ingoldii TaxID=215250 RepID=A0A316YXA6_9BASI|nr:hypothetical protein FA10DRAFT_264349 [Acaromyces ingoldii]PWN93742.1 hypothetical protein FA10DRAFT_264349 [Acaromyces ingoldii]
MASQHKYDVVVFGATGYTGKKCAAHLSKHPGSPRWAIAGRSSSRLESLRKELSLSSDVGTIVADTFDAASVRSMVTQAKCLMNVVGPFRLLGGEAIATACVEAGTHYLDLSGETLFNASLIENLGEKAKQKGVILAPSVGLDSLPFDLATYLAVQQLKKTGAQVGRVDTAFVAKGSLSGGTILSACDMAEVDRDQLLDVRPDWLSPLKGAYEPIRFGAAMWMPQFRRYGIHTPFTPHNHRIVNLSHGLLEQSKSEEAYGPKFSYRDAFVVPGPRPLVFLIGYFLQFVLLCQVHLAPVRWALRKILPPNYGLSDEKLRYPHAFLDVRAVAYPAGASGSSTAGAAEARLYIPHDGGYVGAAEMMSEAALLIAEGTGLSKLAKQGGVLTGATIGAKGLVERLTRYADFKFDIGPYKDRDSKKTK